jgi:hypothetical protein
MKKAERERQLARSLFSLQNGAMKEPFGVYYSSLVEQLNEARIANDDLTGDALLRSQGKCVTLRMLIEQIDEAETIVSKERATA